MSVRLAKARILRNMSRRTRTANVDQNRIIRSVKAGRPIRLYRGVGGGGAKHVKKGQSWTTSPRLAMDFADWGAFDGRRGGKALLYSVTVPASDFKNTRRRLALSFHRYDDPKRAGRARILSGDLLKRDPWSLMRDRVAMLHGDYDEGALEVRPNKDRPDLKPKIVGFRDMMREGYPWRITRRLQQT